MNWRDLVLRVRALARRKEVERDLEDEIGFHLAMQTRKNVEAGMSEREAAGQARREFGGATQVREECRDARRIGLVENTWRDMRYALRGFRRSPGFAATVVATIALGLGLVTALFTVLDAVYLRPLAVREARSLYEVFWQDRSGAWHDSTWDQYRELVKQNPSLSEALAYRRAEARMDGRNVSGILVSPEYFQMLGVGASVGRPLLPEDAPAPGRDAVVVLSYGVWQRQFGGDPGVVGRKVLLRGRPFEVVGVAPEGFHGLGKRPTDFWAPLSMTASFESGPDLFGPAHPEALGIVVRLAPGFNQRQARAGITAWAQRYTEGAPGGAKAMGAELVSRATAEPFNPKNALMFTLALAAFAVVLLIGCANVANMMLARSVTRQREIGVRLSLGATRGRLVRQLLTESLLLAVPAAAAGLALSRGIIRLSIRVLLATLPPGIAEFSARVPDLSVDWRVFGFGLAAGVVSAVLFGLAPSLKATRSDFLRESRPERMRNLLVTGQVAVCVLLLVTAALLLRGIQQVGLMDAGLSRRDNLVMTVGEQFRGRVLARLAGDPSVGMLAAGASAPVDRKAMAPVTPEGGGATMRMATNAVSPEYFPLFEIPLVSGRTFTPEEARTGAGVAIVSQAAAARLWPRQSAVGQWLRIGSDPRAVAVIGVARDETSRWVMNGEESTLVYTPAGARTAGGQLFVRPRGDAEAVRRRLDAEITAIDGNALTEIHKLQIQAWVADDTYSFRILYWMVSAIGLLALLLTLSGIYGVLSYTVSQRTKEIGIRMALGATAQSVTGLVLRQSMRLAVVGTVAGAVAAMGLAKVLSSAVAQLPTFDAPAYLGGAGLVLAACAAAAYFPSRRAAHIDPLTTLRHD